MTRTGIADEKQRLAANRRAGLHWSRVPNGVLDQSSVRIRSANSPFAASHSRVLPDPNCGELMGRNLNTPIFLRAARCLINGAIFREFSRCGSSDYFDSDFAATEVADFDFSDPPIRSKMPDSLELITI